MPGIIEKVTAFITRSTLDGDYLLLFEHPQAGIQIPAGTVEAGETPEAAALRETAEETGLTSLTFRLFWAHLTELPAIVHPQDQWLAMLSQLGDF